VSNIGNKIILFVLIEISQGIKTFWVYLKGLLEKYFKLSIITWRSYFEKIGFQNTIFAFIQILCKLICKGNISKMIHKSCITEKVFEKDFQILFYKVFTLIAKELIWKP
jgi:hypothetical protein